MEQKPTFIYRDRVITEESYVEWLHEVKSRYPLGPLGRICNQVKAPLGRICNPTASSISIFNAQ